MLEYTSTLFKIWLGGESQHREAAQLQSPAELLLLMMAESENLQPHSWMCPLL